jgi:putative PIN family toxin of toxin-antitoxin system
VFTSGLLWAGPPNQLLQWARDGVVEMLCCEVTIDELRQTLLHEKFSQRLSNLQINANIALNYFINRATFVPTPDFTLQVVQDDPFDNVFLALAAENAANLIVSGDKHLLEVYEFEGIHVVTPSEACRITEMLLKQ